jgi:hypothetical protein
VAHEGTRESYTSYIPIHSDRLDDKPNLLFYTHGKALHMGDTSTLSTSQLNLRKQNGGKYQGLLNKERSQG